MFADTFHKTMREAMDEIARRRADPQGRELMTRIERSPYGGFRVRSTPADFFVDTIADGPMPISTAMSAVDGMSTLREQYDGRLYFTTQGDKGKP